MLDPRPCVDSWERCGGGLVAVEDSSDGCVALCMHPDAPAGCPCALDQTAELGRFVKVRGGLTLGIDLVAERSGATGEAAVGVNLEMTNRQPVVAEGTD